MMKTIALAIVTAAPVLAQTQADRDAKLQRQLAETRMYVSAMSTMETSISSAPYSAEETSTTTQTLFDGNRIVNTSTTKVYRDAQGRTRVERTIGNIGNVAAGQPKVSISINDPVAMVSYTLDPDSRTAFKSSRLRSEPNAAQPLFAQKASAGQAYSVTVTSSNSERIASPRGEQARHEDLGTSNMAGVAVKGTRTITTIPAGTIGNDRDINIVEERWYSPELKMNIMTKRTDPRMGETVFQVNNLSRANPDASLFQVPGDYQIKEVPTTLRIAPRE